MVDLEDLYFEWLLTRIDPDGVREGVAYLCSLLYECPFKRRVGNDINRAVNGANLRKEFLTQFEDLNVDPHVTNAFLDEECTWLEMLIALSRDLDYLYDGGVEGRFLELITNMQLDPLIRFVPNRSEMMEEYDEHAVRTVTNDININRIDKDGHGGLFPLKRHDHPDQREVEIWDQHAAYFRERLEEEGVLWTSTR